MAINLPFKVPLPRRFIILGLSASILFLFLHTFAPTALPPAFTPNLPHAEPDASYFSPSKWLPPIFNPNVPDRPPEFDEDGQCLFLSPYDALSPLEKRRAEYLELEEVSAGVFRAKPLPMTGDDDPDYDDEFSEASNATRMMPAGITHPIIGLLKEGEKRWKDKLGGQSTTLDQAAQKYHDKWGRPPPKGFDLWCVDVGLCLCLCLCLFAVPILTRRAHH
jgi:beta-1,2-xylosyltransferase